MLSDIVFARRGAAGLITLNRPQALNAVSLAMVRALAKQLAEWEADAAVTRVIVTRERRPRLFGRRRFARPLRSRARRAL